MSNKYLKKLKIKHLIFVLLLILLFGGILFLIIVSSYRIYYFITSKFTSIDIKNSAYFYKDVKYCFTNNPSQEMNIYLPKNNLLGPTPAVIYIHGGGWYTGSKNNEIEKKYAPLFISRGIAFVSVDYRLSNEALYPAQNEDVSCAVKYIHKNGSKFNLNPNKIGIMGDSAGGHLAAMEALKSDSKIDIKAVLMLYGVSDLWNQMTNYNDNNAIDYIGEKNEIIAKNASPMYADLNNAPVFMLIHGDKDDIVPISDSIKFNNKLKSSNNRSSFLPIYGAGHGFVGSNDQYDKQVEKPIINFFVQNL